MLCFLLAQLFEFVLSNSICRATNGAINGAFFQSLLTLLSVFLVWVLWHNITEDRCTSNRDRQSFIGPEVSISRPEVKSNNSPDSPDFPWKSGSRTRTGSPNLSYAPRAKTDPPPPKVFRPTGAALTETLDALDKDEGKFLDAAEAAVRRKIEGTKRMDCIAIIQVYPSGYRRYISLTDPKDWTRRFIEMARHKEDTLPKYERNELDSYLSRPIIDTIGEVRATLFKDRDETIGKFLIGMLNDNSTVQR